MMGRHGWVVLMLALAAACEQSNDDTMGPPESFAEETHVILRPGYRPKLDVLLVLDDSAAMTEFQTNIAANLPAFIDVLEDPAVAVDYRFGVTTTSVEH